MQTALQIGKEYSQELKNLAEAYERVARYYPTADDEYFWGAKEVKKVELLSAFWWMIAKINDPTYMEGM